MILRFLAGSVIILVIAFFLVYSFFFSVNFPYQDDFLVIQFIDAISQGDLNFSLLVTELFRTFNDHKAVTVRLLALAEYYITGNLNFRFYISLVLVNLIYIFYFVYRRFKKGGLPLYYFLPAPFLFFQPLFHEVSGWALNGMQHSFITSFTVTSITLASRRNKLAFAGALACCFLATFTHGNGILSFTALIFFFLSEKSFKKAIIASVVMFASLAIYLIGYESGQAMNLPKSIGSFLFSLFGFIGSSMSLWAAPETWSAAWGFFITAFMIFLTVKVAKGYFGREVFIKPGTKELLSFFVFIMATSFVIAVFRSWMGSTISSRFQIYASLSSVIFYVLLLDYTVFFRKKMMLYTLIGLSVFYWVYSYYKFTGFVANKRAVYLADVYNWENNRNMFSVERTIYRNAGFYMLPAYEKGYFKLPVPVVTKNELDSMYINVNQEIHGFDMFIEPWQVKRQVAQNDEYVQYFYIASNTRPENRDILTDRFLVLKARDSGATYLMSGNPKIAARKVILTKGTYFKNGFNTFLRQDDLNAGVYDLAILDVRTSGEKSFYKLDKSLRINKDSCSLE